MMKKTLTILIAIVAIWLTAWQIVQSGDAAGHVDESQIIVAQYEWDGTQHQISLADLETAIGEPSGSRKEEYKSKEGQAEYLEELINEKLKLLDAIGSGLDKDEVLLKAEEELQHQLMVKRLIEIEVDEKISYTEAQLKVYYEGHKEDYVAKAKSRASCICLTDKDRAQEVLDQIKGGKDIMEMAEELSENGELRGPGSSEYSPGKTRVFAPSVYPRWQKFVDAVFGQELGEMTEDVFEIDVEDRTYYMIFRKNEYTPERQKLFDEVVDNTARKVEDEKKRQRFAEWMEAVRNAGKLKTYPDRIPELSFEEHVEAEKAEVGKSDAKSGQADGTVIAEFACGGKHQITLAEMQQEISGLSKYTQKRYNNQQGLEAYINLMAESRLILCLAKDLKLDEDPKIVKAVQASLHESMVDKITELEVDQKLKLTEADYRLYYGDNKSDYVRPEQVRLTCITLKNEEQAEEVFQRIKDGEVMAEIAIELSDKGELTVGPGSNSENPGDTGFFSHSDYTARAEAFADAAFALEVGRVIEAIFPIEVEGEQYYIIFRKEEYREARQQTFDESEVRRSVERDAESQKREDLMNDWLIRLHERAQVKTFADRIPDTPKEAEVFEGEFPETDESSLID